MFISIQLILTVLFTLSFESKGITSEQGAITNEIECGDLLSRYGEKPPKLKFIQCSKGEGQVVAKATYQVSGENAKEVEDFLVKTYGMGALKFVCCVWEPQNGRTGQIISVQLQEENPNYSISISMFASAETEETMSTGKLELDRDKIDYFTVVVEIINV